MPGFITTLLRKKQHSLRIVKSKIHITFITTLLIKNQIVTAPPTLNKEERHLEELNEA